MRLVSIVSRLGAILAFGVALSGCGGADLVSSGGSVVQISERDFSISAPKYVTAGDTVLSVENHGPDDHELIVVRTNGSPLPLRTDGLTVDEDAIQHSEAGALEPGDPGSVRTLDVHLTPGRYVLLCNMSGHYMGGMHAVLVVK
jgi:uncharacterized cupredoxin-like copper-binding protein